MNYIIDDTKPIQYKKREVAGNSGKPLQVFYDITKLYEPNLVGPKVNKE